MARETETRKTFTGVVVSDKNDKSIVVLVTTDKKHPIYSKRVMQTKKFHAHDENNEAHVGDTVQIMECRPLSATKRFRLVKVLEKKVQL
ncbi:MAG: 30S ribosomal protein S17 [Gammaproteobacteria bacterium]|nr:30S ribosomal protein S17 [Gammaproteobacteria bacterium]